MPHLLITGITGSGKSIFLDGMILGLIFKHTPDDLRFVMLAGMPELVYFRNLPHLLGPLHYFEDYGKEVINILKWLEDERDQRLSLMKSAGCADFHEYNLSLLIHRKNTLPRIVVVLEHYFEFSGSRDWQTTVPMLKEVDPIFLRLVRTAHPAGIHLVITNHTPFHTDMSIALKESFQARVGFWQNHPDNSVRALGRKGAESLASPGDILFRRTQALPLERYQACNVDRDEALRVVEFWHDQV
jgi:S-DNA-T family DNA segregation ATPase FtsK/SpoIIIE